MFVAMGLFSQALMINPVQSLIQSQEASDIITTKNSEGFTLSFSASNADRKNPVVYSFAKPIPTNWQLVIQNNLTYSHYSNAKTIIKIQEPYPSEKFIERWYVWRGICQILRRQLTPRILVTLEYMNVIAMGGQEISQYL